MKLSEKQRKVLQDAKTGGGRIFQTAASTSRKGKHSLTTLASLVNRRLLERAPVGVVWTLTDAGRAAIDEDARALKSVAAGLAPQAQDKRQNNDGPPSVPGWNEDSYRNSDFSQS